MPRVGRLPIDGELLARQLNLPAEHEIVGMGTDQEIGHFLLIAGASLPEVADGQPPPVTLLDTAFLSAEASAAKVQARQAEREPGKNLAFGDLAFPHRNGIPGL